MGDEHLRSLERRWTDSGTLEDEVSYLVERKRQGLLSVPLLEVGALCGSAAAWHVLTGHCQRRFASVRETARVFGVEPRVVEAWRSCPVAKTRRGRRRYDLVEVFSWRWRRRGMRRPGDALNKLVRAIHFWSPVAALRAGLGGIRSISSAWQDRFPYDQRPHDLMRTYARCVQGAAELERFDPTVSAAMRAEARCFHHTTTAVHLLSEALRKKADRDRRLGFLVSYWCCMALVELQGLARSEAALAVQKAVLAEVIPWALYGREPEAPAQPRRGKRCKRDACPICKGLPARMSSLQGTEGLPEIVENMVVTHSGGKHVKRCPLCRTSYELETYTDDEDTVTHPANEWACLTRLDS